MNKAVRGDWVQIHRIVLEAGQRAAGVPEDTARVPLELRAKGFLLDEEGVPGQEVRVRTVIGREVRGTLISINPSYPHDFGRPVPELLAVGPQLRKMLREADG